MTAMTLPLARYRFTAHMQAPLRLPDYAGSLLRGQFGAALRGVACMTRQPTCGGCPLRATCPCTRVFEAPPPPAHALQAFSAIPNAYVIEPPAMGVTDLQAGDALQFHMVLAGDAIAQLALIVFAWQRALAQGLTRARSPAQLQAVDWIDADGHARSTAQEARPALLEHARPIARRMHVLPAGIRDGVEPRILRRDVYGARMLDDEDTREKVSLALGALDLGTDVHLATHGADLNTADKQGTTALMAAAFAGAGRRPSPRSSEMACALVGTAPPSCNCCCSQSSSTGHADATEKMSASQCHVVSSSGCRRCELSHLPCGSACCRTRQKSANRGYSSRNSR